MTIEQLPAGSNFALTDLVAIMSGGRTYSGTLAELLALVSFPVQSVNSKTGKVELSASDVGAMAEGTVPITKGGTGATSAAAARRNLGFGITDLQINTPASKDFNTIINTGLYYFPDVSAWGNAPSEVKSVGYLNMLVIRINANQLCQVIFGGRNQQALGIYVRYTSSGNWGPWLKTALSVTT